MKRFIAFSLTILFVLSLATHTLAHDGWSQTNTPIVEQGEVIYVEVLFGNHSNDHASYRIDGTWNTDTSNLFVTAPTGDKIDISKTLFYTGELSNVEASNLGINNYHVGSFSSSTPGIYILSMEGEQVFTHGEEVSRTLRSAKSFAAVSEISTISHAADLDGYDQQINTDRAELVPLFNPTVITPNEEVAVQFFLKGEPKEGIDISIIRRSTSESEVHRTDENGIITFTTGSADYYLLRAKPSTDEAVEGEYDQTFYESTMTFTVQNGNGLSVEEIEETVLTNTETEPDGNHTAVEGTKNSLEVDGESNTTVSPFLYLSIFLALALVGTGIYAYRK